MVLRKLQGGGVSVKLLAENIAKLAANTMNISFMCGSAAVVLLSTLYNLNFNYDIAEKINQEEDVKLRVIERTIRKLKFNIKILNNNLRTQIRAIKPAYS